MRDELISTEQGEEKLPAIFLPTGLKQPFPESHPVLRAAFPCVVLGRGGSRTREYPDHTQQHG